MSAKILGDADGPSSATRRTAWLSAKLSAAIAMVLAAPSVLSLPEGGQVTVGSAAIQQPNATQLNIDQGSSKAVVDWHSFSIAVGEAVNIHQPSVNAVILNRVVGDDPSRIYGQLSANGQVFLVNPSGVVFGPHARVDVGSLTASTLKINNEDFLAGRYRFSDGEKAGSVDNQGRISARHGGYVALLGHQVNNAGTLNAPGGSVALGAGERVSLDLHGDGLLSLKVDAAAAGAKVSHSGTINAQGGEVILSAHAKNALVDTVLNVEGTVRATGVSQRNGEIYLDGGDSGVVNVTGTLDASNHAEQAPASAKSDSTFTDSDPEGSTLSSAQGQANGGSLPTAASSPMAGRQGGKIAVQGEHIELASSARLDASGDDGGGEIYVGGGKQGAPISASFIASDTPNAKADTVAASATLDASATVRGNGGTIVAWSEGTTSVAGSIKAEGGRSGGDGGFIETSGKNVRIDPSARASTLAPQGKTGDWLLDPNDYTIATAGGDETPAQVEASLATSNRTIQTTAAGTGGNGDINVNDAMNWTNANSLTLTAYRNVNVNAHITSTGSGGLTLRADNTGACVAGAVACGTVNFLGPGQASVNGGNVDIYYNPAGSNGAADTNGNIALAYATPTDYSGSVSLNGASQLNAYMLVNDVNQLQSMNTDLAGSYALGSNIDATATLGWNAGAGFAPVGYSTANFTGKLDGGGHTITGLSINRNVDNLGLFGWVGAGALIHDIGLVGVNISSSQDFVGALAGLLQSGASISNSYSTGHVTGGSATGGLVGENNGSITSSYSTGTVTGTGGGSQWIGGLVGENVGSIANSFSAAKVSLAGGACCGVGGLVGDNIGSVTNSFWDTQTSGQAGSAGGVGLTTAQMMQQANFTSATAANGNVNPNWDFAHTWAMVENHTYPLLQTLSQIVSGTLSGAGNAGKTIQTAQDGNLLSTATTDANGFYYLVMPANSIPSGHGLLFYLTGGGSPTAAVRLSDSNNLAGVDLTPNTLTVSSNSTAAISNTDIANAKGGLVSPDIPYSAAGANLTLASGVAFLSAAGSNYTLDGDITTTNANLTIHSTGPLVLDHNLNASGGAITLDPTGSLTTAGGVLTADTINLGLAGNTTSIGAAGAGRIQLQGWSSTRPIVAARATTGGIFLEQASGDLLTDNYQLDSAGIGQTIELAAANGAIMIFHDYSPSGWNTNTQDDNITLIAGLDVSEFDGHNIIASSLTTSSVGGAILNSANAVGRFNATNSGSGSIELTNTAGNLTVTGISQSGAGAGAGAGGGNVVVNNTGQLTIWGGTGIHSGGGKITLSGSNDGSNASGFGAIVNSPISSGGGDIEIDSYSYSNGLASVQLISLPPGPNIIDSGGGTITVNANGGLYASSLIVSGGGAIALKANNTGADNGFISILEPISTGNGRISLTSDNLEIQNFINAGAGPVTLKPATVSTVIQLGQGASNSPGTTLGLSDAALNNINTTGGLTVGDSANTGGITVVGDMNPTGVTAATLTLVTGGSISGSAGSISTSGTTNLALSAATGIGDIAAGKGVKLGPVAGSLSATNITSGDLFLNFTGSAPLNLPVAGISQFSNGNLRLDSGGPMVITGNLNAGTGLLSLNPTGALTRTGGTLTANTINLGLAGNTTSIGATGAGRIQLQGANTTTPTVNAKATTGGIFLEQAGGDLQTNQYALDVAGAGQTIELAATIGNITIGHQYAPTAWNANTQDDNLSLSAQGSILSLSNGSSVLKTTGDIRLNAAFMGNGQSRTDSVLVDDPSGQLYLDADGEIHVWQTNTLNTQRVTLGGAGLGTGRMVTLGADGTLTLDGAIGNGIDPLRLYSGNAIVDGGANASANTLRLQAQNGVGSPGAPIQTAASSLSILNGTGPVVVHNQGSLQVDANTFGGLVDVSTGAGGNLTVGAGIDATSAPAIKLSAGANLSLNGNVTGNAEIDLDANGTLTRTGGTLAANTINLGLAGNTTSIGADGAPIATSTAHLNAQSSAGGIWLSNEGSLTLSAIAKGGGINAQNTGASNTLTVGGGVSSTTGDVTLQTAGSLMVDNPVSAGGSGNITLAATGSGSDIIFNADALSGSGAISATAGRNVTLNAGSLNTSGPVALSGTAGTVSEAGTGKILGAALLTTNSKYGTTLNNANRVAGFNAINTAGGDIQLTNTAAPLTVTGISETGGVVLNNNGEMTVAGAIITDSGAISLTATGGALGIKGALTTASGNINLAGSAGINFANNVTTNSGNITFDGAVALPLDPAINAGSGNVIFTGPLDGPQYLTVNSTGLISFLGPVGGNTPLAYLSVGGGGLIAINGGLVRTTGAQSYAGPVTAGNLLLDAGVGSITAVNPGNAFGGTVSASGGLVMLAADQLRVGSGGITGQQIILIANQITSLGVITVTNGDPSALGLSLIGLGGEGQFGVLGQPILVNMGSRFTVAPDSPTASIVYLQGPISPRPIFTNSAFTRLIDYNGELILGIPSGTPVITAALTSAYSFLSGVLPNFYELGYPKENELKRQSRGLDLETGPLPPTLDEINEQGIHLPDQDRAIAARVSSSMPGSASVYQVLVLEKGEAVSWLKPFSVSKAFDISKAIMGKRPYSETPASTPGSRLPDNLYSSTPEQTIHTQLDQAFEFDAGEPLRRILTEIRESGYARENIRKQLVQGLVLEAGVAGSPLDEITDEGLRLHQKGCGPILAASWPISDACP